MLDARGEHATLLVLFLWSCHPTGPELTNTEGQPRTGAIQHKYSSQTVQRRACPTIGSMTIKGTKEGLLIGDVLLKGEAVVLVLLLEARLPTCSGHAGHGARHPCRTLHRQTIQITAGLTMYWVQRLTMPLSHPLQLSNAKNTSEVVTKASVGLNKHQSWGLLGVLGSNFC